MCSSIPPSNHKWHDFKEACMFSPPLTQELCDDVFSRAGRLAQVWALSISDGSLWTHPPFLLYQILGLLHAYSFYARSMVVSQFLLYYSAPLYHCVAQRLQYVISYNWYIITCSTSGYYWITLNDSFCRVTAFEELPIRMLRCTANREWFIKGCVFAHGC